MYSNSYQLICGRFSSLEMSRAKCSLVSSNNADANKWQYTTRGLKKCSKCGEVTGQRAQLCRNPKCELRKQALAAYRPYDPIKLVSQSDIAIFSLRSKERDQQPRNFVDITDVALSLEKNSMIVSRNAVCYVETCRKETAGAGVSNCRHVKACSADNIPLSEVYAVQREVLGNLNIGSDQKQLLWNIYKSEEKQMTGVQRLNDSTFVVKCLKSKIFPAGRLHVTVVVSSKNSPRRKSSYACACKMLKIIVEPDNSLVMQDEICDHLLLVLSAILSKPNGKLKYECFINALKSFWMPEKLEMPLAQDAFLGMHINISGDFTESDAQLGSDDVLIFGNGFLLDDKLPDFADSILNTERTESTTTAVASAGDTSTATIMDIFSGDDANLLTSCDLNEQEVDMHLNGQIRSYEERLGSATHLELTDCNIELMDQFQLTDQIDLSSDDFTTLPISSEPINILAPPVFTKTVAVNANTPNATTVSISPTAEPLPLPPIELPTIAVVKKAPIRPADVVTEVKTRKHPHIPAKRELIINDAQSAAEFKTQLITDVGSSPALAYAAWLDHIIECLNESVTPNEPGTRQVEHNFDVHKEMFSHFCKSFSSGMKRRMPDEIEVIQTGKYKGHRRYYWFFCGGPTVRRIFSTQNLCLQTERAFERRQDGSYIPYVRKPLDPAATKKQRVYPKLSLYMTYIIFGNANEKSSGVHLTWIPDVYPKSQFGVLNLEFKVHTRDPDII